jgi:hypothetical protein
MLFHRHSSSFLIRFVCSPPSLAAVRGPAGENDRGDAVAAAVGKLSNIPSNLVGRKS